jgi:hypothetical protein
MVKARVWKNRVTIICPACRDRQMEQGYTDPADGGVAGEHTVPFSGGSAWTFNGDTERPTLSPSLLLTYDFGDERKRYVCHSFVTDGRIQYLGDCTHPMAGQVVDLPEIPLREESQR